MASKNMQKSPDPHSKLVELTEKYPAVMETKVWHQLKGRRAAFEIFIKLVEESTPHRKDSKTYKEQLISTYKSISKNTINTLVKMCWANEFLLEIVKDDQEKELKNHERRGMDYLENLHVIGPIDPLSEKYLHAYFVIRTLDGIRDALESKIGYVILNHGEENRYLGFTRSTETADSLIDYCVAIKKQVEDEIAKQEKIMTAVQEDILLTANPQKNR